MARLTPTREVLRALFARSGNQCAFPGCTQPLINRKNQFIGQVCHIEAAIEGGARYNPASNDDYRRSYENLLILCYPHHIETNDVDEYPAERLRHIKLEHEQVFEKANFKIDEAELIKLSYEMEKYWNEIERLNKIEHIDTDSAMEVNGKNNFSDVLTSAYEAVNGLEDILTILHSSDEKLLNDLSELLTMKGIDTKIFDDIPYYENPFVNRNWEFHNLGAPNWLQRLRIDLVHIEVKYLEEYLKTNSNDLVAQDRFEKAKELLKDCAKKARHVD